MKQMKVVAMLLLLIGLSWSNQLKCQQNISLLSLTPTGNNIHNNDVWGYVDEAGNEYAIIAQQDERKITIYDVSNPQNPQEVHVVEGFSDLGRDVKAYKNYIYAVESFTGGEGLFILNMENAPNTFESNFWKGEGWDESDCELRVVHNIFIDEQGYAYLCGVGCNGSTGVFNINMVVLDLNSPNPYEPEVVATFNEGYVHDAFVRGDTAWLAELGTGFVTVWDVSDKNNFVQLGASSTPGNFPHNVWLSDNNKVAFVTDEIDKGCISAYDVSDPSDIQLLDKINDEIASPHNVYVKDDFVLTSYYAKGITIHDAKFPDQLVEVGHYDTSPLFSASEFSGCWGIYPYLPSGNLLASDMEEGLYILEPSYEYAARLIVNVKVDGVAQANTSVNIGDNSSELTNYQGQVYYAQMEEGMVDVEVISSQYGSQVVENVPLHKGSRTILNIDYSTNGSSEVNVQIQENYWPIDTMSMDTMMIDTTNMDSIGTFIPQAPFIELSASPNPFKEQLNIQLNGVEAYKEQTLWLSVVDKEGKKVYHAPIHNKNTIIDTQNWTPNMYYYQITNTQNLLLCTGKLIRQ